MTRDSWCVLRRTFSLLRWSDVPSCLSLFPMLSNIFLQERRFASWRNYNPGHDVPSITLHAFKLQVGDLFIPLAKRLIFILTADLR